MKKLFVCFAIIMLNLFVICYASDIPFVTKAVMSVKDKIDIPVNYENFNSKLTIESGRQYAYLTWYGDENENNTGGQINVIVDDKLRIVSFNQYFYGEFEGNYKLSSYSSADAEKIANDFFSKVSSDIYDKVQIAEQEYSVNRNFESYSFRFIRYENDLPCYDNYADIKVDALSGNVISYKLVWTDYDKIYHSNTQLNPANAEVSMFDNIGMVKEYAKDTDGNLYVRYADLSDGINYINAYTGNLINTNYVSRAGNYKNALTSEKVFDFWYIDKVQEYENALNVIFNNLNIPLENTYAVTGSNFIEDSYSTYLYIELTDDKGNIKTYIVDTVNGDLRYYNLYQVEVGSFNLNMSGEECLEIANDFVYNYEKSFINQCKLLNYTKSKNYIGEDVYYFNYTRYINDISYDENGVVVCVSRSTGDILSVTSGWENIAVPEYSLTIAPEEAFAKYIDSKGFELQYVTYNSMTQQTELRPVFAPNPLENYYVNAVSGDVIDNKGNQISLDTQLYTDVGGDVSKQQILTLYACDIFDGSDRFYPDDNVLLCDYLLWICRAIDCEDYKDISEVSDKLVSMGLVTYEDLLNNQFVNTETGIKYIVSYLGYDDVAILTDTYQTGFVDEGMISEDLMGYAAIAKGLKIFEGNAFLPKENMKRNVAAQIIYNLISN